MAFAERTEVNVDKTQMQMQIRQMLRAAGAATQGLVEQATPEGASTCGVAFELKGRRVRFSVILKPVASFRVDDRGRSRTSSAVIPARAAEERRLWRCLLLTLKARLEAVGSGIETFDEAFLAHVVMPDGQTVYESTREQIAIAYRENRVTGPLLALPPPREPAAPSSSGARVIQGRVIEKT